MNFSGRHLTRYQLPSCATFVSISVIITANPNGAMWANKYVKTLLSNMRKNE